VFRFSGDRLVYWAQLQEESPQENLPDEAEVDLSAMATSMGLRSPA